MSSVGSKQWVYSLQLSCAHSADTIRYDTTHILLKIYSTYIFYDECKQTRVNKMNRKMMNLLGNC